MVIILKIKLKTEALIFLILIKIFNLKPKIHMIKKILHVIDIFGIPIEISFNQQKKHKTVLGGFATLFVLIVFILSFYTFCKEIWEKKHPLIMSNEVLDPFPAIYPITS